MKAAPTGFELSSPETQLAPTAVGDYEGHGADRDLD
jgi:hypothetical protein